MDIVAQVIAMPPMMAICSVIRTDVAAIKRFSAPSTPAFHWARWICSGEGSFVVGIVVAIWLKGGGASGSRLSFTNCILGEGLGVFADG